MTKSELTDVIRAALELGASYSRDSQRYLLDGENLFFDGSR